MDIDATQAIPLSDYDDETDDEISSGEKQPVATLKVLCQKGFPLTLFSIYEGLNLVGREAGVCNVHIANKALSKQHACIEVQGSSHLIYDKGSRNKTKRDKLYLTPEVRYELKHNEKITFADLQCVYIRSDTERQKDAVSAPENNNEGTKAEGDDSDSEILPPSEPSSDILQPTQAYHVDGTGPKMLVLGGPTLNFVDDSEEEEEDESKSFLVPDSQAVKMVADTPVPRRTRGLTGGAGCIPESDSDATDDEGPSVSTPAGQPDTLVFDMDKSEEDVFSNLSRRCILDEPTQKYEDAMDSDATDDGAGGSSAGFDVPTLAVNELLSSKKNVDEEGLEPTQVYGIESENTGSKVKLTPAPGQAEPDEATLVYSMDVEAAEDAGTSAAENKRKAAEADNGSEFGDSLPTQCYTPSKVKAAPRKISWGGTVEWADEPTQVVHEETATAATIGNVDLDAPTLDLSNLPTDSNKLASKIAEEPTQIFEDYDVPALSGSKQSKTLTTKSSDDEQTQVFDQDAATLAFSDGESSPEKTKHFGADAATQLFDPDTPTLDITEKPTQPGARKKMDNLFNLEATQLLGASPDKTTRYGAQAATQLFDPGTPTLDISEEPTRPAARKQVDNSLNLQATQLLGASPDKTTRYGAQAATQLFDPGTPTLDISEEPTRPAARKQVDNSLNLQATQLLGASPDKTTRYGAQAATQLFDPGTPTLDISEDPTRPAARKQVDNPSNLQATQLLGASPDKTTHYGAQAATQLFDPGTPTLDISEEPTRPAARKKVDNPLNLQATQLLGAPDTTQILGDTTQTFEDIETPVLTTFKTPFLPAALGRDSTFEFNPQMSSTQVRSNKTSRDDELTQDESATQIFEDPTAPVKKICLQQEGSDDESTQTYDDNQHCVTVTHQSEEATLEYDMDLTDDETAETCKDHSDGDFRTGGSENNASKQVTEEAYTTSPTNSPPPKPVASDEESSDAESEDMLEIKPSDRSVMSKRENGVENVSDRPVTSPAPREQGTAQEVKDNSSKSLSGLAAPVPKEQGTAQEAKDSSSKTQSGPSAHGGLEDLQATQAYGVDDDDFVVPGALMGESDKRESIVFSTRTKKNICTEDLPATQAYGVDDSQFNLNAIQQEVVESSQLEEDLDVPVPIPDLGKHSSPRQATPSLGRGRRGKVRDTGEESEGKDKPQASPSHDKTPERISQSPTRGSKPQASPTHKKSPKKTTQSPTRGSKPQASPTHEKSPKQTSETPSRESKPQAASPAHKKSPEPTSKTPPRGRRGKHRGAFCQSGEEHNLQGVVTNKESPKKPTASPTHLKGKRGKKRGASDQSEVEDIPHGSATVELSPKHPGQSPTRGCRGTKRGSGQQSGAKDIPHETLTPETLPDQLSRSPARGRRATNKDSDEQTSGKNVPQGSPGVEESSGKAGTLPEELTSDRPKRGRKPKATGPESQDTSTRKAGRGRGQQREEPNPATDAPTDGKGARPSRRKQAASVSPSPSPVTVKKEPTQEEVVVKDESDEVDPKLNVTKVKKQSGKKTLGKRGAPAVQVKPPSSDEEEELTSQAKRPKRGAKKQEDIKVKKEQADGIEVKEERAETSVPRRGRRAAASQETETADTQSRGRGRRAQVLTVKEEKTEEEDMETSSVQSECILQEPEKKRGRKSKEIAVNDHSENKMEDGTTTKRGRSRGRPAKKQVDDSDVESVVSQMSSASTTARRGRSKEPLKKTDIKSKEATLDDHTEDKIDNDITTKRGRSRGRPAKKQVDDSDAESVVSQMSSASTTVRKGQSKGKKENAAENNSGKTASAGVKNLQVEEQEVSQTKPTSRSSSRKRGGGKKDQVSEGESSQDKEAPEKGKTGRGKRSKGSDPAEVDQEKEKESSVSTGKGRATRGQVEAASTEQDVMSSQSKTRGNRATSKTRSTAEEKPVECKQGSTGRARRQTGRGKSKASTGERDTTPTREPAPADTRETLSAPTRGKGKRSASPMESLSSQECSQSAKKKRTGPTPPATPAAPAGSQSRRRSSMARSAPSTPGTPTLRKKTALPKVMFTGVVDDTGSKIVKQLGGDIAETIEDCTHLVTDKCRRTVKFLCGLARGIPIVSPNWLDACKEVKSFLDAAPFVVADPSSEKNYGFKLKTSLETAAEHRVFAGWKINVTKNVKPEPTQMKEIVKCAGGQYLASCPKKYDENVVVVSCEADEAACKAAIKQKTAVVSAEFILTGILRQEVNLTEHRLFV